jgi:hypothetical protein
MTRRTLVSCALLTLTVAGSALAAAADARQAAPANAQIADLPAELSLAPEANRSVADEALTRTADVGYTLGERTGDAPACTNASALFTWNITDGCVDGHGLYVRFFDTTNDLVWPNSSQVYTVPANKTGQVKLTVKRGAKICYGAETNPPDGGYWGLSLDGDQSCSTCCTVVPQTGNVTRTVKLTC